MSDDQNSAPKKKVLQYDERILMKIALLAATTFQDTKANPTNPQTKRVRSKKAQPDKGNKLAESSPLTVVPEVGGKERDESPTASASGVSNESTETANGISTAALCLTPDNTSTGQSPSDSQEKVHVALTTEELESEKPIQAVVNFGSKTADRRSGKPFPRKLLTAIPLAKLTLEQIEFHFQAAAKLPQLSPENRDRARRIRDRHEASVFGKMEVPQSIIAPVLKEFKKWAHFEDLVRTASFIGNAREPRHFRDGVAELSVVIRYLTRKFPRLLKQELRNEAMRQFKLIPTEAK